MSKWKKMSATRVILQGQAGVWQVASQLALREHTPLFPGADLGYDLQMENGLRLQVKTANLRIVNGVNYPCGAYCFALRRGAWLTNEKRYTRSSLRGYSDVADFFVLWGIDENRFFIVPTSFTGKAIWFGRRGFTSKSNNRSLLNKRTARRVAEYEDRWDLLDVDASTEQLVESAVQQEEATN